MDKPTREEVLAAFNEGNLRGTILYPLIPGCGYGLLMVSENAYDTQFGVHFYYQGKRIPNDCCGDPEIDLEDSLLEVKISQINLVYNALHNPLREFALMVDLAIQKLVLGFVLEISLDPDKLDIVEHEEYGVVIQGVQYRVVGARSDAIKTVDEPDDDGWRGDCDIPWSMLKP